MHRILAFLILCCGISLAQSPIGTFKASSLTGSFAVGGTVTGEYQYAFEKLTVNVKEGKIVRLTNGNHEKRDIVGIRAFVAAKNPPHKNFRIIAKSQLLRLDKALGYDESISISGTTFPIALPDIPLEKLVTAWLGFEIVVHSPTPSGAPRPGTCYIHVPTYLFGNEKTGMVKE